jgi:outer membrane protein OmpA-like peptidoglycan-associated protein
MSLRYSLKSNRLSVVTAILLGLAVNSATPVVAADDPRLMAPAVQTYADQAVPVAPPASQQYYNSPLSAGTLTLEDVLEAHKPADQAPTLPAIGGTPSATATAPVLTPPTQSSSTGLMLSQGMKDVLQKVGDTNVKPVQVNPPVAAAQPQAQGQPAQLVPASTPVIDSATGLKYQPGEEPKNLGGTITTSTTPAPTTLSAPDATVMSTTAGTSAPSTSSCGPNPQKWEKTCGEAGYPTNYVGKIVGETRTGCADGTLHDVWVTNTCAPPDAPSKLRTDGACGPAANNEFSDAPSGNLCATGTPSSVSGNGPWNWACSGANGGDAAACSAQKRTPSSSGVCGSANGAAVSAAPSSDLCEQGTATLVKGSGPWRWMCKGSGKGGSESCIAPLASTPMASTPVASEPAPVPAPVRIEPENAPVASASDVAPAASTPSSEKGELCGAAAEILAYQAPEKDLCRVGTASTVNGDGPWTWSCTDNEGVTSACRTLSLSGDTSSSEPATPQAAPQAAVSSSENTSPRLQPQDNSPFTHSSHAAIVPAATPVCGLAASQPAMMAPTSDLCDAGKPSAIHGSNPWRWTCGHGSNKVSCATPKMADAACGVANGAALKSAPFSGLCASGTPSSIEGDGPWSWSCNGSGGGASVSCAASVDTGTGKIDGTCGASDKANASQTPSEGLCASGTASSVSGNGPWTWSCSGTNGGAVSTCSASRVTPPKPPGQTVNGLCGFANGVTASSTPTEGLCGSGDASAVVGNGPWNWSCGGENGGMTVSCTAPLEPPAPIDGACGGANGVATLVKPQSGLCAAGLTGAVNGHGPWTWTCSGANGGSPASCIAAVAGKTASMPSKMTSAKPPVPTSDDMDTLADSDAPLPTALVTPQLPSSGTMSSFDKKALPSLTPSKPFAPPPSPTHIPAAASVTGDEAPNTVPDLPNGMQALQPPTLSTNIPPAAVLQDQAAQKAASIPGNHLTLDPTISTILFARGSGNIEEGVTDELDRLANVLQFNPDVRISLYAYADNGDSTPRDARRMSLTRGLAVKEYLASKGISESRVDVHAEGSNSSQGYIDRVDVKVND